jgi:hypothetical protein
MTDRRRTPRYNLSRSTKAEINLLQDVSIQSAVGDDVVVLASKFPESRGRLLMEVVRSDGEVASLDAEIVDSAPVVEAGTVRFRLQLRVAGFARAFGLNLLPAFE